MSMIMIHNGKRVKSIRMHQIKNEMITKLMQQVRGQRSSSI